MSDTLAPPEASPAGNGTPSADSAFRPPRDWESSLVVSVLLYVVSFAVVLGLAALIVAVTGHSPSGVFTDMYKGSLKDWGSIGYTLDQATPLLIVALGTIICVRAGHFNIGQEGQLTIGAMTGALVGLKVGGPGPLLLVLTLLAAAAGGALWAGIAALLRMWRGIDVVISSLLLIFVANQVLEYSVNATWLLREHNSQTTVAQSDLLSSHRRLPRFGHYPHLNFTSGLLLALALTAILVVALGRTRWGFRLRLLGMNPTVAQRAGVSAALVGGMAIVLSGAFAGLAGGVMLTGQVYRVAPGFANNVGFDGLLVALIARNNPAAAVPVSIFFGIIVAGGGFLATSNVPADLVNIVQALLVLAAVFPPALIELRRYRRNRALARSQALAVVAVAE
jgi:general nucleoside transport system permease protein